MIRAVVIEDEPLAAKFLAGLLDRTGRVQVVGIAREAEWGFTLCSEHSPDAVFLDIRMPGQDGIELAKEFEHLPKPPLIVFTTGHSDRACDAFRLHAVDYLVKPLEFSQVCVAVSRLEALVGRHEDQEETQSCETPFNWNGRLPVKCLEDDSVRLIPREQILAAIHHDRRTWIHTGLKEYATYYVLCELSAWLGDPPFVRISRESVINLQAVAEVVHYGDRLYQVRLQDRLGTKVVASRSGSAHLAALLKAPV